MSSDAEARDSRAEITNTTMIVAAYVSKNPMSPADIPKFIGDIYGAVAGLGAAAAPTVEQSPAIPIKSAVQANSVGCLECGLRFSSLKRHIGTHHNLTPEQYRSKWRLTHSQGVMVPASYSARRSALAKQSGLGRKLSVKGKQ